MNKTIQVPLTQEAIRTIELAVDALLRTEGIRHSAGCHALMTAIGNAIQLDQIPETDKIKKKNV